MAFRFRLQPALERARTDECAARVRALAASRTLLRAQAALAACETRLASARHVPRPRGCAAALAAADATAIALGASLAASRASRDDARDVLARERTSYDAVARRLLGLERLRARRLDEHRACAEVAEAAACDESNAGRGRPPDESESCRVIALHRANGHPLVVNAELIETVEVDDAATTIVTLTTGNVLAVTESPDDVRALAVDYRRTVGRLGG